MVPAAQPSVLTSWKEIAQYAGTGVRTVQRWECDLGFPVRRTKTGRKSSVLAVPGEIDAWVQSLPLLGEQPGPERTTLLRTVKALRSENRKLRRQLAFEREKKNKGI
jgi:predicted DNA-binding transcriptional regulator AlpA